MIRTIIVDVDLTLDRSCGAFGEADVSVSVAIDLASGTADVGVATWKDALDDPSTEALSIEEEERARSAAWEKFALDRGAFRDEAA